MYKSGKKVVLLIGSFFQLDIFTSFFQNPVCIFPQFFIHNCRDMGTIVFIHHPFIFRQEFLFLSKEINYFYFSTKAPRCYTDIEYPDECYLIFGKESRGIPEEILKKNLDKCVRIPMLENLRSLNLSNSAAIAVYEVLRQRRFADLEKQGFLKMLYTN